MQDVTGVATQQDLLQLRTDLLTVQQTAQRARAEAEAINAQLDRRLREQTAEDKRQAAALSARLDAVTVALQTLTRRLDDLTARLDTLDRRPRGAAPPLPAPTAPGSAAPPPAATTPGASSSAAATSTAPGSSTPPVALAPPATPSRPAVSAPALAPPVSPPRPALSAPAAPATPPAAPPLAPSPVVGARSGTGALRPEDVYQAAYIDFSRGSYPLAMAGFREFLRRFPDHPQAGAAQYWIGEAQFSIARGYANAGHTDKATEALEQAVHEFRKVVANYPRSDRAPTAIYKEALALLDLKLPAQAQSRLQYLVDNFPSAEETPLARERLAALKPR